MHDRFSGSMKIVVGAAAVGVGIALSIAPTSAPAQAPVATAAPAPALKTPWGEPNLQGIWTDETDTPLQRSPKYANQEFFTAAQRAELDQLRSAIPTRDKRPERGTRSEEHTSE